MLKAVAGGGGRGMRPVTRLADLDRRSSGAARRPAAPSASGELYVEELLTRARHVEVQIVGDGTGAVAHLWDRECSLQRQRQKLIEIAPAFGLPEALRARMLARGGEAGRGGALRGARHHRVPGRCPRRRAARFAFIEAKPRLQVEHTVTEAVPGLDLVRHPARASPTARTWRPRA